MDARMVAGKERRLDPSVSGENQDDWQVSLRLVQAFPVGDPGCGRTPIVKAFSIHPNPLEFGECVKEVLAALTNEEVAIYHLDKDNSWNNKLRHYWMENVVYGATSLDWHPLRPDLYVGDEQGRVTMFRYNKQRTDRGTCSYEYDCIYQVEQQTVCSLRWYACADVSHLGECLLVTYTYCIIIFQTRPRGLKKILIDLKKGPWNYVAALHPTLSYLFVGADNHPDFRVFTNLTPAMRVAPKWREIICRNCPHGMRDICFGDICFGKVVMTLIITAGPFPKLWHFWQHKDNVIPELNCVGIIDEDKACQGLMNSVDIVGSGLIACGYVDGTISLYKVHREKRRANAVGNFSLIRVVKLPPDERLAPPHPMVTCLKTYPSTLDDDMFLVGGNHGFVRCWMVRSNKTKKADKQEWMHIELEKKYYTSPESQNWSAPLMAGTPLPLSAPASFPHDEEAESSIQHTRPTLLSGSSTTLQDQPISNISRSDPMLEHPSSVAPHMFPQAPQLLLNRQTVQSSNASATVILSNNNVIPKKDSSPAVSSNNWTEHTCKYYYNSTTHDIKLEKPEEMRCEQQQLKLLLQQQHQQQKTVLHQHGGQIERNNSERKTHNCG